MPRKVDPHRGEDGYTKLPNFEVGKKKVAKLAETLGTTSPSPDAEVLRAAIQDIGDHYLRWKKRGAGKFSRAQVCAALKELLEEPDLDCATLMDLNERALHSVLDALLVMKPAPLKWSDSVTQAFFQDRIDEETLRQAIHDAIARLEAIKGRDRKGELAWATDELCQLYEELTGKPVTQSNKGEHRAYVQEPQSQAGRFLLDCFQIIDPGVIPSQISRSLRRYIEKTQGT